MLLARTTCGIHIICGVLKGYEGGGRERETGEGGGSGEVEGESQKVLHTYVGGRVWLWRHLDKTEC